MKKKIRPRFGGFIFVISSVVECTGAEKHGDYLDMSK